MGGHRNVPTGADHDLGYAPAGLVGPRRGPSWDRYARILMEPPKGRPGFKKGPHTATHTNSEGEGELIPSPPSTNAGNIVGANDCQAAKDGNGHTEAT